MEVKRYIPNPLRCFQCQEFGHSKKFCKKQLRCWKCGSEGHDGSDCSAENKCCVNCKGDHYSSSKSCPVWIIEKEIQRVKTEKNLPYGEAKRLVSPPSSSPATSSYASAVSLYVEAGELPLEQRRIKLSLQYITKLKSTPSNPAYECIFRPNYAHKYLKNTKVTAPLGIRMKEHIEECDIQLQLKLHQINDDDVYDIPPWELSTPTVNLALHSTNKKETSDVDFKQRFLEINDSYLDENYMTVYTDGSKSDDYVSASAVFPLDILKVNLAVSTSIFTAEAVALKLAVQYIQRHPSHRTVIYSDSLSCLQALENKNLNHPLIREIIQILTYLKEVGSIIEFCWIPGHIGIKGNEKADKIAKEVIDCPIYDTKFPYSDLKPRICQYVNSVF